MKKISILLTLVFALALFGNAMASDMSGLSKPKVMKADVNQPVVDEVRHDAKVDVPQSTSVTAYEIESVRGMNPGWQKNSPSGDLLDFAGSETFDADLGEFTTFEVTGDGFVWQAFGNPDGSAFYDDISGAQDAYLISIGTYTVPDIDNIHLNFDQYENFGTYYVYHGVYVTTAYTGDPTTTTWDTLYQGVGAEDTWQTVHCALETYRNDAVTFAFHYIGDYADEWSIDNIDVSFYDPIPPPANDDCAFATALGGTFPITGSGTTIGATVDCPGVLDWNGVWYTFEVPYAANDISINVCGVAMDVYNGGIVLMDDCVCDDYTLQSSYAFDSCNGYVDMTVLYNIYPGPATVYWPALVEGPGYVQMDFTFTIDCTEHIFTPGDNCGDPAFFTAPGSMTGQTTCGRGNNYQDALGDTTILSPYYDGGEDMIVEITIATDTFYNIAFDPKGTTYGAFGIGTDCPPTDTVFMSTGSGGTLREFNQVHFAPGTYYMMVDTWASPDCIPDFDFSMEYWTPSAACDEDSINLHLLTDTYGSETTWDVVNVESGSIAGTGGPYANSTYFEETVCIFADSCYDVTVYDAYGDGIYDPGYVNIYYNSVLQDSIFGSFSSVLNRMGYDCPPLVEPDPGCCTEPDTIGWGLVTSDATLGYMAFDDYACTLLTEVGHVTFYGGDLQYSGGWMECTEDPTLVNVRFYNEDTLGFPDWQNPVYSYNIAPTKTLVTVLSGAYDLWQYDVELPTPHTMTSGWISIQGNFIPLPDDTCVFMWAYTYADSGNYNGLQLVQADSTWNLNSRDYAFCVMEPQIDPLVIGVTHDGGTEQAGHRMWYEGSLTNNTASPITTDVWVMIGYNGGTQESGPWSNWLGLTVAGNTTDVWPNVYQWIPRYVPAGDYSLIARCG
ncbi:MAG: hypothetical protein GY855_14740, partial [candidate division Zixibacteria bacterium]|nr:hypothetical protein [candidate division Zixibacteria bacterium]